MSLIRFAQDVPKVRGLIVSMANSGASMSGDLKHPSKAIPKGTLYGLGLTFICYTLVILAMAATTTRASFYRNVNVIQDVSTPGDYRKGKRANY